MMQVFFRDYALEEELPQVHQVLKLILENFLKWFVPMASRKKMLAIDWESYFAGLLLGSYSRLQIW